MQKQKQKNQPKNQFSRIRLQEYIPLIIQCAVWQGQCSNEIPHIIFIPIYQGHYPSDVRVVSIFFKEFRAVIWIQMCIKTIVIA
jgi:hypothetical protein